MNLPSWHFVVHNGCFSPAMKLQQKDLTCTLMLFIASVGTENRSRNNLNKELSWEEKKYLVHSVVFLGKPEYITVFIKGIC